ncbi:MAG TPA: tectonin domain-containing protein, partial [Acidobacteriaceae bacterium]|nr:tectonin domain-containing protein [Acidobacteriaceae bacterium]
YHWDVLHGTFDSTSLSSVSSIAVGSGAAVFALQSSGDVFQWDATSQTWIQLPGSLTNISAGANGTVWGVSSSGNIYQLLGAATRPYQTLRIIPGATVDQISVGADGAVWAVDSGTVEYFNTGTQSFEAVPNSPPMTQVSVGAGNDVWGVYCSSHGADNCTVYEYVPGSSPSWKTIPGELNLVQVAANGNVWGINAPGETYHYDFGTSSWVQIPGNLGTLSVGVDGDVWGINGFLQVYRYSGGSNGTWNNIPGSLMQISVGSKNAIWGVNAQDQIYNYVGTPSSPWANPAGSLGSIWATFDGAVWGVNNNFNLYQWNGSSFAQVGPSGSVTQVVLGNSTNVWATNATTGAVYAWF